MGRRFERTLFRDVGPNCLDDFTAGRHHAKGGQGSAVDHRFPVDEDFVLAISAVNHLDIDA